MNPSETSTGGSTPPATEKTALQPEQRTLFATAFYHTTGNTPNIYSFSTDSKFCAYYRCMVVCYASIRRNHPDAKLVLFSNQGLPEPFASQLESLDVETLVISDRYVADADFSNTFPGCLFTLDVISHLAATNGLGCDTFVILDNDCILLRPLDKLLALISRNRSFHALEIPKPACHNTNGQSRASLTLATSMLTGQLIPEPITFCGGEFYAFTSDHLQPLDKHIARFWNYMRETGKNHFGSSLTEEHVVSAALCMAEIPITAANSLIKRIWTSRYYSSVAGDESKYEIWHLPAEKKSGFSRIYNRWVRCNGFEQIPLEQFPGIIAELVRLKVMSGPMPMRSALLRLEKAVKCLFSKG